MYIIYENFNVQAIAVLKVNPDDRRTNCVALEWIELFYPFVTEW